MTFKWYHLSLKAIPPHIKYHQILAHPMEEIPDLEFRKVSVFQNDGWYRSLYFQQEENPLATRGYYILASNLVTWGQCLNAYFFEITSNLA